MYYLYQLNKLKICFQSESHKNITKSKQSRKFFVSPVKFTKVHVRGFVNEPTSYRSSLIWVHAVCERDFLNISADKKSRWLLLGLAHYGLKRKKNRKMFVIADIGTFVLRFIQIQNSRTFQALLKDFPTVFKDWKLMQNTDLHITILLQKC